MEEEYKNLTKLPQENGDKEIKSYYQAISTVLGAVEINPEMMTALESILRTYISRINNDLKPKLEEIQKLIPKSLELDYRIKTNKTQEIKKKLTKINEGLKSLLASIESLKNLDLTRDQSSDQPIEILKERLDPLVESSLVIIHKLVQEEDDDEAEE